MKPYQFDGAIYCLGSTIEDKRAREFAWCNFLDALRHPGLSEVHSQEATLEDVFVQVTGRTLQ